MVTKLEASEYRCLRYASQLIRPFQVLVGPNASGKSTFLDIVAFLGDFVQFGIAGAVQGDLRLRIRQRAADPTELVWMREGKSFQLALELGIPQELRDKLPNGKHTQCRYEVTVDGSDELGVTTETLWLKPEDTPPASEPQRELFPMPPTPPRSLALPPGKHSPPNWRKVVSRGENPSNVTFMSETGGWNNPFRLPPRKSALANLPEDEVKFPVATWVKRVLTENVQRIALSTDSMRMPSPPGRSRAYLPDGSNLPWVIHDLESRHPEKLRAWVGHLREALPDLETVTTREREEDRHRYLLLQYANNLAVPSWLVSDGTLRLLALTLLAYVPDLTGIYLIEEPENGIHPRAVEVALQSLSSVYGATVLCATHSPVVVSMAKASQILCFARHQGGATAIVPGDRHPGLKQWKGEVDLGTLFASGVLG